MCFAALVFCAKTEITSQAQKRRTSSIFGTVVDQNSARVAGARITIQNARFKRVLQSDDAGIFQLDLPPDSYQITVEQAGFEKFVISSFLTRPNTRAAMAVTLKVQPPQMPWKIASR